MAGSAIRNRTDPQTATTATATTTSAATTPQSTSRANGARATTAHPATQHATTTNASATTTAAAATATTTKSLPIPASRQLSQYSVQWAFAANHLGICWNGHWANRSGGPPPGINFTNVFLNIMTL